MRRLILVFLLFFSFTYFSASADETCGYDPYGNAICAAQIDWSRFIYAQTDYQYQSQWCWAASISAVFGYYGYEVNQTKIVSDVFGTIANLPANGVTISQQINRKWVDDNGRTFTSKLTGAYDADYGVDSLSWQQVIFELRNDRPLIIGTGGHAMVLTSISYYVSTGEFFDATVFDPWPQSGGLRRISTYDLTPASLGGGMRFLASTSVTSESKVTPPIGESSGESSSAGSFSWLLLIALVMVIFDRKCIVLRNEILIFRIHKCLQPTLTEYKDIYSRFCDDR